MERVSFITILTWTATHTMIIQWSDGYHKLCFTTICSCHHILWVFYFPVYCVSLMK
jgi:bacteriorhodopsin